MTSKEYIENRIKEKNLSKKYEDLYNQIMINDLASELESIQNEMLENKNKITEMFDLLIEAYQYLVDNQDAWQNENNEILFNDYQKLEEYNSIVEKLQQKAKEIEEQTSIE